MQNADRRWRTLRIAALPADVDPGARELVERASAQRFAFAVAEPGGARGRTFADCDVVTA